MRSGICLDLRFDNYLVRNIWIFSKGRQLDRATIIIQNPVRIFLIICRYSPRLILDCNILSKWYPNKYSEGFNNFLYIFRSLQRIRHLMFLGWGYSRTLYLQIKRYSQIHYLASVKSWLQIFDPTCWKIWGCRFQFRLWWKSTIRMV